MATPADIREKVREGPRYTVERIERHRIADGKLEFLVHWVGYDDPTWEPRRFLPEELISRYFARQSRPTDRHIVA